MEQPSHLKIPLTASVKNTPVIASQSNTPGVPQLRKLVVTQSSLIVAAPDSRMTPPPEFEAEGLACPDLPCSDPMCDSRPVSLPNSDEPSSASQSFSVLGSPPHQLKMLDLFSGTGSVGARFLRQGYDVVSVDIRGSECPTHCVDILRWCYKKYPVGYFDVIAASPPCADYSLANNKRPRNFSHADRLVRKTIQIIRYFAPRLWWIENPRGGFLKSRDFMKGARFLDVDYCQFSDWGYQKPTRIWCCAQIARLPSRLCDGSTCPQLEVGPTGNLRHRERLGGNEMKFSQRQKGRMPAALVDYLMSAVKIQSTQTDDFPSISGNPEKSTFLVSPRWLQKVRKDLDGVVTDCDQALQLLMPLQVELHNGTKMLLNALVDTGAQVNLIRSGLVAPHLLSHAESPIRLLAANGQTIQGGDKLLTLRMDFLQVRNGVCSSEMLIVGGTFFQAAIEVDMILSYPWLRENKIGVFAHHNSLALDEPEFTLLYGWKGGGGKKRKRNLQKFTRKVWMVKCEGRESQNSALAEFSEILFPNPQRDFSPELEEFRQEVRKMNLQLPVDDDENQDASFLTARDVRCAAIKLRQCAESQCEGAGDRFVNQIIQAHPAEGLEDPRVQEFRDKIHKDYDGEVFNDEVPPDPPVRGPYGYAYIPLIDNAVPTRSKPFRLHGEKHDAMVEVAQQWKDRKFIEPVPEGVPLEWASNSFPVPKKDGKWRGVVDVRGPNSQTRRIAYPLPVIEDLLVKQGANQMFSILDLRQAFHQQPLHPDSRPITSCYTPLGVYQWRVNVMGLMNASQQFQQMMEDRLYPVRDVADPYIDDILVGTRVGPGEDLLAAHDKDLRRVLDVLKKERLIVDMKKPELFVKEVTFCGHRLGGGTRRPAPGKLRAIEKWQVPQTISELRAFLGFTNYYNSYIKDYSRIVARLQDKLKVPRAEGKKGSKKRISWDKEDERAFQEIKNVLCSQLVLQRVNPDKPFVLRVDASKVAVGATLEQLFDEERAPTIEDVQARKTVPVAFMSRKLTGSQRNWTPREQETYAIIAALLKWESWIGLQPVLVLTDHKSLESWAKEVLDTPSGPLGRRSRWHQILSKFDLSVGYIPGKENMIADILSRWAYPASQAMRDISKHGTAQDKEEVASLLHEEMEEEANCVWLLRKESPKNPSTRVCGVLTRSGKRTETPEERVAGAPEGLCGTDMHGGTKPHEDAVPYISAEGNLLFGDPGIPEERGVVGVGPDERLDSDLSAGINSSASPVELASLATSTTSPFSDLITPIPKPANVDFSRVWELDWGHEYEKCPRWGPVFRSAHGRCAEWPKGVKLFRGFLYSEELLCIPYSLQEIIIREHHAFLGHVGHERLWKAMELRFQWADRSSAMKFSRVVMGQCESCQACQKPVDLKGILEPTPIPPAPMTSVALDLFDMPPVEHEGRELNTIVLSVDRHSGWVVAVPERKQGLTGAKVAKLMQEHQWRLFGVPSVVTCDRGSHFVSEWWQTMCALMGIRVAFSHAYFHHTNGRAERAGQQLIDRLRKVQIDTKLTWVELLPRVLDRLHDTPGEGGLSPYQILFGRNRPLAGVPYEPPHCCEDAVDFFHRMAEVDVKVAARLNGLHAQQVARTNAGRKSGEDLRVGDKVWYLRPPDAGNKLDTKWIGPVPIVAREGEHSYVVETKPGHRVSALRKALKLCVPDNFGGEPVPLFYHQRTVPDPDAEPDEWRVEKILGHRKNASGGEEFKTKWEGSDRITWEPLGNFFPRVNSELIAYCKKHKIGPEFVQHLSPNAP